MEFDLNDDVSIVIAKSINDGKYQSVVSAVADKDNGLDDAFKARFNSFFRVVCKKEAWISAFYSVFEEMRKQSGITFEKIITRLYEETGEVEPGFASKILACIDTDKPIWEKYVLNCIGLTLKGTGEERVQNAVALYAEIEKWYESLLSEENTQAFIKEFSYLFPSDMKISPVKKIDFYLWAVKECSK